MTASLIDLDHERAQRSEGWIKWTDQVPPADFRIVLRGEWVMTGQPGPDGVVAKFVRRTNALCRIEPDGSLYLVRPPYDHLEWKLG